MKVTYSKIKNDPRMPPLPTDTRIPLPQEALMPAEDLNKFIPPKHRTAEQIATEVEHRLERLGPGGEGEVRLPAVAEPDPNYPVDPRTISTVDVDPVLAEFNKNLESIQNGLNEEASKDPPKSIPDYQFVSLAEQCADGMVQAAEAALAEAQSNLASAKAHADALRSEIKARNEQIATLTERLKSFGGKILEAHENFHGSKK